MSVKEAQLNRTRSLYWNAGFLWNTLMTAKNNERNLGKKNSMKQKTSGRYKGLH